MGTSYLKKGFSPFQINYIQIENQFYPNLNKVKSVNNLDKQVLSIISSSNLSNLTSVQPMSTKTFQCYERVSSEVGACVCADCEKTCDVLKQSALPRPDRHALFSGQDFSIFLGWLLFAMVFTGVFAYFLLIAIRKRRTYSRKCNLEICLLTILFKIFKTSVYFLVKLLILFFDDFDIF